MGVSVDKYVDKCLKNGIWAVCAYFELIVGRLRLRVFFISK